MSLFATDSLPLAERQAMRLDGELYRLGELYVPISIPEVSAVRAAATRLFRSDRLIPARRSAAWIWGATPLRPDLDEFVVDTEARWRPRANDRIAVIETVLESGDVRRTGDVLVTSPLRTAIDLCRFPDEFTAEQAELVRELGRLDGFELSDCLAALDSRPRLAGKRRTRARLTRCWGDPLSPS